MQAPQPSHSGRARIRLTFLLLSKLLILGLALFIVACAGTTTASNSTPTTTPTFIRTSGNDLVNVVEESPVAGAVTVHITETEFAFIPEIRVFHPGVHYYFIVHNNGKQTHAFTFVPTNPDGTPLSDIYYQYNHTLINLDTI